MATEYYTCKCGGYTMYGGGQGKERKRAIKQKKEGGGEVRVE